MTARYNDLSVPKMGAVGVDLRPQPDAGFRAGAVRHAEPGRRRPQLLHRDTFIPARSLNILAAAWIQFQVHDWVNHARHPLGEDDVVVPLPPA